MSLSEQEQRILDDIETELQIDDPNLDSVLSSASGRRLRRPIAELVIGATSGLTLVVLGVALSVVVLGVIGFLVLVAATARGQRTIAARRAAKKVNGQTGRR
jgi:hypothetical protein